MVLLESRRLMQKVALARRLNRELNRDVFDLF